MRPFKNPREVAELEKAHHYDNLSGDMKKKVVKLDDGSFVLESAEKETTEAEYDKQLANAAHPEANLKTTDVLQVDAKKENKKIDEDLARLKQANYDLSKIPEEERTEQMGLAAVKKDGLALRLVPYKIRTLQIVEEAVKQNGLALGFANDDQLESTPLLKKAVTQNGLALKFVSVDEQSEDMILTAVKQNGLALEFFHSSIQNIDYSIIISAAVQQNGLALKFVPETMRILDIVMKAVNQNGLALEFADDKYKGNKDTVLAAVKNNPEAIKFAAPEIQDRVNELIK